MTDWGRCMGSGASKKRTTLTPTVHSATFHRKVRNTVHLGPFNETRTATPFVSTQQEPPHGPPPLTIPTHPFYDRLRACRGLTPQGRPCFFFRRNTIKEVPSVPDRLKGHDKSLLRQTSLLPHH